jgi:hypothetical protein
MKGKKINNLTLQIREKSGKIRNASATKRTSVEEKEVADSRTVVCLTDLGL